MIDIGAIGQEHLGKGAPVLVLAVSLERDILSKREVRGGSFYLHVRDGSTLCMTHNDAGTTTEGRSLWLPHPRPGNIQNQTDNDP